MPWHYAKTTETDGQYIYYILNYGGRGGGVVCRWLIPGTERGW